LGGHRPKKPDPAPEPEEKLVEDKAPVKVSFTLRGVDGPFLGESGNPHMLVVFDKSDVRDFNNTVTHEIGHALKIPRRR
jgi:hypothetical protein